MNNPQTRTQIARRAAAFTLLEMMLVVVIIGVLASVAVYAIGSRGTAAKVGATKASMTTVQGAVLQYHLEKSAYPPTIDALVPNYLPKKPKDGWKRDFQYMTPSPSGQPYDIVSYGEDGVPGGTDDISVWTMDDEPATTGNQ